jgi:hypothetical protein
VGSSFVHFDGRGAGAQDAVLEPAETRAVISSIDVTPYAGLSDRVLTVLGG